MKDKICGYAWKIGEKINLKINDKFFIVLPTKHKTKVKSPDYIVLDKS